MPTAPTDDGPAVEFLGLTKVFGEQRAVDDLTFTIDRGRVTGFLGPNGAGKTTALRVLLGLAEPTEGKALVLGRCFRDLDEPSRAVGALIDASGFHPGRRARDELRIQAAAGGIDDERVDHVLHEVGLEEAGRKRVGQLSLGMRQRLGLAGALLGRPELLVLDEPANGLDPAGVHWLRHLLGTYAGQGAAVLVSSHVLSELALFADDVVVLDHGRLVAQAPVAELVRSAGARVRVQSSDLSGLRRLLVRQGAQVEQVDDALVVDGLPAAVIGETACAHGIALHQLRDHEQSLEEVFLAMTSADGGIR